MRLPLALGLCCALLAALAAGWTVAHADEPSDAASPPTPLEVTFYADASVCTAGSMMQVHWQVSSGAEPYQATLNGEPVDASSNSAPIPCGPAYDIPTWLRPAIQLPPINIELIVTDAADAEHRQVLTIAPAYPLPAPRAFADAEWVEDTSRRSVLSVGARREGSSRPGVHHHVARWRALGDATWRYDVGSGSLSRSGTIPVVEYDTATSAVRYEVQVASVRSPAERATPDLLNWSRPVYTTTGSDAVDFTARVTHDTITLTWGPDVEGLHWVIWPPAAQALGEFFNVRDWLGPDLPYEITFEGLVPDTVYTLGHGWSRTVEMTPAETMVVRTKPAPPDWSPKPRGPQNVKAEARGDGLLVTWGPPAIGIERGYEVFVHEVGTLRPEPIFVGRADPQSLFIKDVNLDRTYWVTVRYNAVHHAETTVLYQPADRSMSERIETIDLPDWRIEYVPPVHYGGRFDYKFRVYWDQLPLMRHAEIRWTKAGEPLTRSVAQSPLTLHLTEPGPHAFQIRFQNENGSWSQWSPPLRRGATPPGPPATHLRVRERQGSLIVSWTPPSDWHHGVWRMAQYVDGFKAYLRRAGEQDQILDVGARTSAEWPILTTDGEYEIRVSAYSADMGEGRPTVVSYTQTGPSVFATNDYPHRTSRQCDPHAGIPNVVRWYVDGGAEPYTIQVADLAPFETDARHGVVEFDCDLDQQAGEFLLDVTVMDAHGRSDTSSVPIELVDSRDEDGHTEHASVHWRQFAEGLQLTNVSIHRESLWLMWNRRVDSLADRRTARFWPLFVVRWRETASTRWQYRVTQDVGTNCAGESRWRLGDLRSDVEYEVQVAAYWEEFDPDTADHLTWSDSLTARTLPASIHPELERRGADIVVAWASIPEAWGYTVVLEADGVSWWREHTLVGTEREEVVFRDIPEMFDATLRAQVVAPTGSGEGDYKPGFYQPLECWRS